MLDEKTRALLGDKEAQRRFTERGEMLPCNCGDDPVIVCFASKGRLTGDQGYMAEIHCEGCGTEIRRWAFVLEWAKESAIYQWNDRAPILIPEQIKKLEG